MCSTPWCFVDCEECEVDKRYEQECEEANAECTYRKECNWVTVDVKFQIIFGFNLECITFAVLKKYKI